MGLGDYLLGVAAVLTCVGALALGAAQARRRLLPGWSGMPTRLADAVIIVGLLILTAELIGLVGLLNTIPLVVSCVAVGCGLRLAVPPPPPGSSRAPLAPPVGKWGRAIALAIAGLLFVQWSIGTADALGGGMTGYDSAWYHMPFAAHFAQTGSTLDFAFVAPRYLSWFYPQNSELLHGVGIVLTERDILSPLLNMLWLSGCLGAAWCIGRPYGLAPWTLAATGVLLGSGMMADQAGEARNDTLALFFLLAAIAMILNGAAAERGISPGPLAIAGLSAGLAAGTKLSFVAPAAALLVAAPLIVAPGRRRAALVAFGGPLLAGCGIWYLRNAAMAANPLPWFKEIGPLQLPGPEQGLGGRPQFSVLDYLGDGRVWGDWLEPGLSNRLGELWPLLLAAVVIALTVAMSRAEPPLKLVGLAGTAGVFAYLLEGTSAEGPAGMPVGFASSLRHLLPALCLGLILVPLLFARGPRRDQIGVAALLGGLLVAAVLSGDSWPTPYVVLAVAAAALALTFPLLQRRGSVRGRVLPVALRRLTTVTSLVVVALLVSGGWLLQRSYLRDRYMEDDFRSAGLNAAFAWANRQQEQRIATTLILQYPLFGRDLSNKVGFVGRHRENAGFTAIRRCRPWLSALEAGGYRFVVTVAARDAARRGSRCLARDSGVRPVVLRDRIVVLRLDERPAPGPEPSQVRRHQPSSRS